MSEVDPQVREAVQKKKASAEKRGRPLVIRTPNQVYPRRFEIEAAAFFRKRIRLAERLVFEQVVKNLSVLLADNLADQGRTDDLSDDLKSIIDRIVEAFGATNGEESLREVLTRLGLAVSAFGLAQLKKVFKQSLAVDPFIREPFLQSQIKQYVQQNVALIKSVDDKYFADVQEIVFRGARMGKTTEEIAKEIRKKGRVSISRARLIARDQINKFNGQLNQLRQQQIGVTEYRWVTAQDERVRDKHASRSGEKFKWSDPPDGGHPGEEINCRCIAQPVLTNLGD